MTDLHFFIQSDFPLFTRGNKGGVRGAQGGCSRPVRKCQPPVGENFYACRGIFNGELCSYAQKDTYILLFSPLSGKSWCHPRGKSKGRH